MIYVDSSVVVALLVNEPHSAAVARWYARTKLKPSFKVISLRVPINLLDAPRIEANRRDVPYQSLIKVWLSEKVAK